MTRSQAQDRYSPNRVPMPHNPPPPPADGAGEPLQPGAGDRLLLGYRLEEAAPLGFSDKVSGTAAEGEAFWLEGEGHLITIAPTGAGKGRGALIPNLLSYEGPAIVIDPKGEAYEVTARRRREMGQEVRIIDPFRIVSETTDSLNPLDAFDIPGVDSSSLSMEMAKLLSGGATGLKEPFWDIHGHSLLAGVISAVASVFPGDRHFAKVRSILKSGDPVYNMAVMLDTVGSKLSRFANEEIAGFLGIEDRCRSGILATAMSYCSIIGSDAAQRTICESTIDINAVIRGDPMTIYLVVPPSKLKSHGSLFRLWTSCLMTAVMSRNSALPKYRTLFAIDECAQLGDFAMLSQVYTLARAYGVRVWSFFQDLAQLRQALPNEWQTVLTSSAAIQVFGVPNHVMASDLSAILGDFSNEELRRMDRSDVALQLSGQQGVKLRRPDYLLDARFRGLYDRHPIMGSR